MGTRHIVNDYAQDIDSSATFTLPEIDLTHPYQAIGFQFIYDNTLVGDWVFEATIDGIHWENLVSCEEVKLTADSSTPSQILVVTGIWMLCSKIRVVWTAQNGSSGTFSIVQRSVPT